MNSFELLENYNLRMKTAISELRNLNDGESDPFIDAIVNDYSKIIRRCEHRREVVQRRKYGG